MNESRGTCSEHGQSFVLCVIRWDGRKGFDLFQAAAVGNLQKRLENGRQDEFPNPLNFFW